MLQTALPYRQLMTSKWLEKNADFTAPHTVKTEYLEILPGAVNYERALRVQLVAPKVLESKDSVTVKATVALDPALANSDHDPIIGISDGTSFVGFIAYDVLNYPNYSPCSVYEGDVEGQLLKSYNDGGGPKFSSKLYSTERTIRIRPAEKLGFCHTEHNAGYINTAAYKRSLDPTKGLYFEVYHHNAGEKYRIRYIDVEVDMD